MRKIISLVLAAAMLLGMTTVFAQDAAEVSVAEQKAVLLIYNTENQLVYVKMLTSENGVFDHSEVPQYIGTKRKLFIIATSEIIDVQAVDGSIPTDTTVAVPTAVPEATNTPLSTDAPAAATDTPKATSRPSVSERLGGTPYEKEADTIYSPAVVIDVASDENSNGEEIYTLTVFYQGREINVEVDRDITISNAPDVYKGLEGASLASLEKGDVVYLKASISGDEILSVDLITRPPKDDIVTDNTNDYGASFEKLFASNGLVAGKWKTMTYGEKASNDRYQYVFGIVGKTNKGNLTLLNKSGNIDDAIDIAVDENAYVYSCDVNGKEYELEIGDATDIISSLPSRTLDNDVITLDDEYSYNYAIALVIDGVATDVILYNNYNY